MRNAAMAQIKQLIEEGQAAGSVRLFSVRHEFPTEWHRFKTQTPPSSQRHELAFTLKPEHYPFWAQGRLNHVTRVDILARSEQSPLSIFANPDRSDSTKKGELSRDDRFGRLLSGQLTDGSFTKPTGELKLYFDDVSPGDLWIAITWTA
ncbi:MAG TPA: hypothetical protein VNM22_11970 [Candidatus Limnocylindrales bacterium]|nr:hypothetical protein [Candidatus Limnocylindrales bacterium]